jgi:hypothetical protein
MAEQCIGNLPVMCLACRQAEPDRESLRIDDGEDFGREAASGTTETMISIPFLPSRPVGERERKCCRSFVCRRHRRQWMASIIRSQTPAFRYRTKRLSQVVRGPQRSGGLTP